MERKFIVYDLFRIDSPVPDEDWAPALPCGIILRIYLLRVRQPIGYGLNDRLGSIITGFVTGYDDDGEKEQEMKGFHGLPL